VSYSILIHSDTYNKIDIYRRTLMAYGIERAGVYFQRQLQGVDVANLNNEAFLERLVKTKPPMIFAEMSVYGNGEDWNQTELSILGDIGVVVPVQIYDDGKHIDPQVHSVPITGTLLFTPGALLRNDTGNIPADWAEVIADKQINILAYQALYERRLLPLLLFANQEAYRQGKRALITLPGLGCGQFAGRFRGTMGAYLKDALITLLVKHVLDLSSLAAVYYDPYNECQNERYQFESLVFFVRPFTQGNQQKSQLCPPCVYGDKGDDFNDCLLFSIVAWDHVSWPGNDFYGGHRFTDDGVKAAATNSMTVITGVEGHYDPDNNTYDPPSDYCDWGEVIRKKNLYLKVQDNLYQLQ
jgi:hypothetical protein